MLFPLVVAFASVALGTWLALGPREGTRLIVPIRLTSLVAALAVITTHLLPESWEELGARAVVGFLAGIAIPSIAEATSAAILRRRPGPPPDHGHGHGHGAEAGHPGALAALEIGYFGLLAHRFGDGLSMGAVGHGHGDTWTQAGVVLTLAAHIVPVTTVMILAIVTLRGRTSALVRAAGLALSTMAGVVLAWAAVDRGHDDVSPWISAVVAGLLIHIVAHDVPWLRRRAEPAPAPTPR